MKSHFYIGETLIESFEFDPENIGILTTKEMPKHSEFTNSGSYVESIIWHMVDAQSKEMSFHPEAYKTADILTVKIKPSKSTDLFEWYWLQPDEVAEILSEYELDSLTYHQCGKLLEKLEDIGYTFDYGLDAQPFELKKIQKKKAVLKFRDKAIHVFFEATNEEYQSLYSNVTFECYHLARSNAWNFSGSHDSKQSEIVLPIREPYKTLKVIEKYFQISESSDPIIFFIFHYQPSRKETYFHNEDFHTSYEEALQWKENHQEEESLKLKIEVKPYPNLTIHK